MREHHQYGHCPRDLVESLRITAPQEVFSRLSENFGAVNWVVSPAEDGYLVEAEFCPLSSQAKVLGAPNPCLPYCLEPIAEMVRAVDPECRLQVCETLWDGQRCRVKIR